MAYVDEVCFIVDLVNEINPDSYADYVELKSLHQVDNFYDKLSLITINFGVKYEIRCEIFSSIRN